ncbi:MAG: metallophosphoesterase family protein [Acidimicrobiia bacterium]
MSARVLVLSDTHIRRGGSRSLPAAVLAAAARADAVLHAGDIVTAEVLTMLEELAPVHAVLGNNDHELVGVLPLHRCLTLGDVPIGMVHDSGPSEGRPRRLRRMFPEASVVIFGHSHQPCSIAGLDGQWLLNPGSSTERRRAPTHTMAWLTLDGPQQIRAELVHLD